jgi:hypothetical protein
MVCITRHLQAIRSTRTDFIPASRMHVVGVLAIHPCRARTVAAQVYAKANP